MSEPHGGTGAAAIAAPPFPFPWSLIGLGLVGGSLAKAVRRAFPSQARIFGVDPNRGTLDAALAESVIDRASTQVDASLRDSHLVIISTPVGALEAVLAALHPLLAPGTLLSDVIGVKAPVAKLVSRILPQVRYVGTHPMAGGATGGYAQSRADLFAGRSAVVCPNPAEPDATAALTRLWQALGSEVFALTPEEHDRVVAVTSHLPYLAALSLVDIAARTEGHAHIGGRGFIDATRRAEFDPEVMAAVVSRNDHVPEALRRLGHHLLSLADALEQQPDVLVDMARRARDQHRALVTER